MQTTAETSPPELAATSRARSTVPFGVNEMRLSVREWLITFAIVVTCVIAIPRAWKHFEPLVTGPDYRIPYALSKDYWLFQRRLQQDLTPGRIPILGDSVVWGEYVRPDGTLSHFLNQQAGRPDRFVNCGVNGMFPLALEGLVKDYGSALHDRKVIVQCNVLWMTSPKADLSEDKEQDFNHAQLVPQFLVRIPCYRADVNDRLTAVIDRHLEFFGWGDHLQIAYYDQHSIPLWTLEEDNRHPPGYPNAWRNPLDPLKAGIPGEPARDPQRGPSSKRHKPWNAGGGEPTDFEWVSLDSSLQWAAFQRVVHVLRERGDDVLIIVGPFNEHMIAEDQRPTYRQMRESIAAKLSGDEFSVIVPGTLPSELYADASHPLTDGYALLAKQIYADRKFRDWLAVGSH